MKRALVVVAGLVAMSTGTAFAGGYLGLALGTPPGVNDELARSAEPDGRSLRALAGLRFGNFSLEGALNGFGVITGFGDKTMLQASAAAKLSLPLGSGFEGFGRAGIERTWLNVEDDRYDLSGNGFQVGAGFEYRLNAVLTNASLFVDYTIHRATLTYSSGELGQTARIWGLGFTVGL